MKQFILITILFLSSISIYGDNLNDVKEVLSQKIEIEKAEVKLYNLKVKADKSNAEYMGALEAHKNALKESKNDLKAIKKAIKAKKQFAKAEEKYEKCKKAYQNEQDNVSSMFIKYAK